MPDEQPQPPALRASDADRERAADVLREAGGDGRLTVEELDERLAVAYTTRTRSELEALTADLIAGPGAGLQPAPASARAVSVRPGAGGTRRIVSIMGGNDRAGRWRIGERCTVVNVMGGTDLDLNDVELSGPLTTLTVFSLMGGGDVRVPDGVEVEVSKLAIMGGNDVKLNDQPVRPGAPVIRVRLWSIMGGTSVRQGRKLSKAERRRERELRKARARGEIEE